MSEYDPTVFDVANLKAAREIILTPENTTTDQRWRQETPYLADLAIGQLNLTEESVVLDYGCGVGRIARRLIELTGCWVIGCDISASMRALAASYVNSPRFLACAPNMLPLMPQSDAVIAIWVLQHVPHLAVAIDQIFKASKPGGRLLLVNNDQRVIPIIGRAWMDDKVSVSAAMAAAFVPLAAAARLDQAAVASDLHQHTFWRTYEKAA